MHKLQGTSFDSNANYSVGHQNMSMTTHRDEVNHKLSEKQEILGAELIKFKENIAARKETYKNRLNKEVAAYQKSLEKIYSGSAPQVKEVMTKKLRDFQDRLTADEISHSKMCEEKVLAHQVRLQEELIGYQNAERMGIAYHEMDIEPEKASKSRGWLEEDVAAQQKVILKQLAERNESNRMKPGSQAKKVVLTNEAIVKELATIGNEERNGDVADFIKKVDLAEAWILQLHMIVLYGVSGATRSKCLESRRLVDDVDSSQIAVINCLAGQLMRGDAPACVKRRLDNLNRRWDGLKKALEAYRQRLTAMIEIPGLAEDAGPKTGPMWAGAGEGDF